MISRPVTHIISHTDLDGVTAAAVAWHAHYPEGRPIKVTLAGYGEVDDLMVESVQEGYRVVVLDLFCQRQKTVDFIDGAFKEGDEPILFDHHKSTMERYGNRPWLVIDTSACAAKVYYRWAMGHLPQEKARRIAQLADIVEIANDRDLWLGERAESRLWQALISLTDPWSVLLRLISTPDGALSEGEKEAALAFVRDQEERFSRAMEKVRRFRNDLVLVGPDMLKFGDVSDFCGLVLDRTPDPPKLVAVANKKATGEWAVSLRSRDGLAGELVGILRDGKKVRGGGHGDAAALYFPPHYSTDQIGETLLSGLKAVAERGRSMGVTLGDMLNLLERGEGK